MIVYRISLYIAEVITEAIENFFFNSDDSDLLYILPADLPRVALYLLTVKLIYRKQLIVLRTLFSVLPFYMRNFAV